MNYMDKMDKVKCLAASTAPAHENLLEAPFFYTPKNPKKVPLSTEQITQVNI
jgi:hypothetical protein